jgi:hypothetical protein
VQPCTPVLGQSLPAHASRITCSYAVACARASAHAHARARAPYPTKYTKGETAILHARAFF